MDAPERLTPDTLLRRADDIGARADAGMEQLGRERVEERRRYTDVRETDVRGVEQANSDLTSTVGTREQVALPDPDLGPILDPKQYSQFAYGMVALSLIGAIGGRKHWQTAASALDGALQGYLKGNMEVARTKKEEFEREFRTAQAKQKEADRKYEDILKSRTLTLNQKAEMMRIHATEHQDWQMEAAARSKDFDQMYRRMDQATARATQMQTKADALQEKREARAEKRRAGDTGNQGISEKYRSDPEYQKQVDFWAQYMKDGNPLPPRFAQSGSGKAMYSDIIGVVPTLGTGNPAEMRAGAVELAGQKSQARALGTRTAAIEQAASEAREMSTIVREMSSKVERTKFQPINKVLIAFEKNTGDPTVRQLGASINSYINAYARAVNPSGVATVSDKEHAREMLSTADSDEQVGAILDVLDREMTAAQHSPKNVKESLRKEITGGGEGKTVNWSDLK